MRLYVTDGSSACLYYVLHFLKMQDKLGSQEELFLHGTGYSTAYPLSGEKADCSVPQRIPLCSVGRSFRAQRRAARDNQHWSQPGESKLQAPSRAGMCYQQWAGFFSARRWQRQGKLPKNPEGCFGINSTEKKLKVMGLIGKDAEKDHCTIT